MTDRTVTASRWDRRSIGVTLFLLLLFICSVWNWLYNIPVQPNVEIPFVRGFWWMVDAASPNEVLIWNKDVGPVSFYDMRTGQHLFDRLSETDLDVRISFGDPHTALVFRDGVQTVIDLRTNVVRCQIPSLRRGTSFQAYDDGRVLIAIRDGIASAFNADTGALLWSRDDIRSIRATWGAKGDLFCAEVDTIQAFEGGEFKQRQRQVLRVKDGKRDERFDLKYSKAIWMPMPPKYLVEEPAFETTVTVYDLKTGEKRLTTGPLGERVNPYFNADLTELLLPYRDGQYGCRLTRWDLETGKKADSSLHTPRGIEDLVTDDGRYSIGRFPIAPPGYELLRDALSAVGIQIPPGARETPLLVDNHTGKVVGKLQHRTPFNRIELTRTGDAFVQECDDRLAVYFLPIQLNWTRLILSAAGMVISFVATAFKARPLLVYLSQKEIIPAKNRRDDIADRQQ